MKKMSFVGAALVLLVAAKATASTEITGLFDARSLGMGATGVAYLDSAGVIPINPAALDQIEKLSLSVNGLLLMSQPEAPYRVTRQDGSGGTYDNYETVRASTIYAPMFFLGAAYRLFDRVVIGTGVYPLIAMGTRSQYRPAPEGTPDGRVSPDLKVNLDIGAILLEFGEAVSIRLMKTLSFAMMWRITYFQNTTATPIPGSQAGGLTYSDEGVPIYARLSMTGLNFAGFQFGLHWRPDPSVRLGLSYRTKVTVDGEGTLKVDAPLNQQFKARQPFSAPHTISGGVAVTVLDGKLTFAADVKYLMFEEAFKTIDIYLTDVNGGAEIAQPQVTRWKNSHNVHLGGEYRAHDRLALRAGYMVSTSATPEGYAQAAMAPPGVSQGGTAGIGVKAHDQLNLDLAGSYIVIQSKVDHATPHNAGAGIYAAHTGQVSLSATYHR